MMGSQISTQIGQPVTRGMTGRAVEETGLRKACAEFESIFIHYMLRTARKALPENGLFDNTNESKIYKSMMDEQMSNVVTKGRGLGLGELLYNKLREGETKGPVDVSQYV